MKYDYKKMEKELYCPKTLPKVVTIPKQNFFCINGTGDPNGKDFAERIGILYSLAYAVRMMPKNGYIPEGYYEYTVYPLEGLWSMDEEGIKRMESEQVLLKDHLKYTIMIRQPEFVTEDVSKKAFEIVDKKKPHPLLKEAYFHTIEDGLSVQLLHIGSYDNEPESFFKMKKFINENGYNIRTMEHREIYLSDSRKVEKEKLKTILRYSIYDKKVV